LEYHDGVRRWIAASVAGFAVMAVVGLCASSGHAQVNGVPPSVTSQGFGGHAVNGTPPSVTSLGANGTAPNSLVTFSGSGSGSGSGTPGAGDGHHHHHDEYAGPVWYAVPYAVDLAPEQDDSQATDDADEQGGPTVFDRRGSGADSYVPPVKDMPHPHANAYVDDRQDEAPQPVTALVFKDGHEMEVGNYAIVGATLFDLTPGHSRKVALADLDLEATRKVNDDRGVVFELPSSPQAN